MHFLGTIAVAAAIAIAGSGAAWSRTLSNTDGPAEIPPASYTATQYVDSNGCIFVRAGYNGTVNWVPRVTRDKQVLCGYKPTFGQAPAPAPAAKPAREIVVAPPAPKAAPKPAPKVAGAPIETVAVKVPPVVPYRPPVVAGSKAMPAPTPRQIELARQAVCPAYGKTAQDRTFRVNGVEVSCGPQAASPQTVGTGRRVVTAGASTGGRVAAPPLPKVPAGYKPAWTDGRLNPQRGPVTAAGDAQMALVFEPGKVPMVPLKPKTSGPVTPRYQVATKSNPTLAAAPRPGSQSVVAGGAGWVQVGSFGVASNAAATAARLKAAGLPVRVSTVSKGGKSLQIVLAGPFTSQGQIQTALQTARGAGFRDAFVRR